MLEAKAVPICCPPAILTQDAQQSPSGPHWPRFLSAARGLPALPPRTICPFGKTPPSLCRPPSPPATGRSRASSAQGFCEGRAGAVGTGRLLRGHGRVRTHTSVSRPPAARCAVVHARARTACLPHTGVCIHSESVFAIALYFSLNIHVCPAPGEPGGEGQGRGPWAAPQGCGVTHHAACHTVSSAPPPRSRPETSPCGPSRSPPRNRPPRC